MSATKSSEKPSATTKIGVAAAGHHKCAPSSEQWAFRDVRGPRAKVIDAVKASTAPSEMKAAIVALIQAKEWEGVRLDGQGHCHGDIENIHLTITKLF